MTTLRPEQWGPGFAVRRVVPAFGAQELVGIRVSEAEADGIAADGIAAAAGAGAR
jgi:hypothetical protein